MSGINDPLNWDLVRRQTYTANVISDNVFIPISTIAIVAESHTMMVGFRNSQAKPTWRFAATLEMRLLTLPSSTSEFQASVSAFSKGCKLNELTIIKFPNYGLLPFLVEIKVAKWHKEMFVEAWKYSGDEVDIATQSLEILNRIELKINTLQT